MVDLVPSSFWRFPRFPMLEDDDDWIVTTPSGLSISEDDKNIYIEAAVPGVDPKNVEVTYDKGVLWIKGEGKEEEEDKKKKFYRRASSSFSYRVMVPGDIDPNAEPVATHKHGVMKIAFAKSPKTQPKRITIKSEE